MYVLLRFGFNATYISLAELFKGNHVISNELQCNLDGSYSMKYFGHHGLGLFPNSSSSSSKVLSIVIFWIQNDQSEHTTSSPWWCSHELKLIRAQVLPPCDVIYTLLFLMITPREKIHVLNCMSCWVVFSRGFINRRLRSSSEENLVDMNKMID